MPFWTHLEWIFKIRVAPITSYNINTVENFIQLCMTEYNNLERNWMVYLLEPYQRHQVFLMFLGHWKKLRGSLNAEKLVDHKIAMIISIHPLPPHNSAFHEICHWLPQELKVSLLRNPLNILKLGNFFFMMKKTKLLH